MTYIFEERGFKGHLRTNATRGWFSKQIDNARYEGNCIEGTCIRDIHKCANNYTVRVKDILRYPTVGRNAELVGAGATLGTGMAGFGIGMFLAPATFGASLLISASAVAGTAGSVAIVTNAGRPRDIYFVVTGDNSEWVAKQVESDGVDELANNICKWSNEVYWEKFETHAYQEQPPKW